MKFRDVQTFAMVIDPATTGEVTATYTRNNNIARITSLVLRSLTLDGVQGTYPAHIGLRITFNNGYRAEVASLQTSELNCYSFVVPVDSQDYAKWFHTNPPGIAFSMPIPGVTQIRMEAVTFSPTGAETTLCTTGPAGVVQAVFEMEFEQ